MYIVLCSQLDCIEKVKERYVITKNCAYLFVVIVVVDCYEWKDLSVRLKQNL